MILTPCLTTLSSETKRIPPKGVIAEIDGESMKCFSKDEYKQVALILVDYSELFDSMNLKSEKLAEKETEISLITQRLELANRKADIWERNADYYKLIYEEESKLRQRSEKVNTAKTVFPWLMLALQSISFTVVGFVGFSK